MFDINLLPKDVRAKKQKEVARIKASAPKGVSLEKGQKIHTKIVSVNFFGKMWERLARKKKPIQESIIAEKSVLQTPRAEALPPAPPEIPPYPLRPVQVMPMTPVEKKPEEKAATRTPPRAEDGVVLPDISSLIQSTEKEKLTPPTLRHVPDPARVEPTPPPTKPVVIPPPQITKARPRPEVLPESPSVILPPSAPLGGELKQAMAVMPRHPTVKLPTSPLMAGVGGLLVLLAAGSFLGGSYAILQRFVGDLERVQTAYQTRVESARQVLQDVSTPVKEMETISKESSLLYAAYQQWDANQGRGGELAQILAPILAPLLEQPSVMYANGVVTIQGKSKNKTTPDQILEALKGNANTTPQSVFTRETFGDNLLVQFSILL